MNPCVVPQPAPSRGEDGDRWMHIHNRFLSETKEREPDVVILGDSITSQLEQRGVWKEVFAPMHILNFSIIGDQVQNVLWRVKNGELDNIKPKVVVLYVGEFNIRTSKPEEAIEGLLELVKTIKEKQQEAQVLIQELLPRGLNPNPLRDSIETFNNLLKESLKTEQNCKVIPVGDGIVKADGTISHVDLVDWYYPSNDGYLKAFGPLIVELKTILQKAGAA
ncbi:hypothetical protein FOCC_FOCC012059 [Frankliniella occidentalis]|uniref:Platelet-activating factor acetylhydrolase IB subunit alpha2-like n=1 Tax=Frankliniella occidentalis TaxID=133901 RepID=A0A6J1SLZ5_FRAOC|nr:platelet-activating factor acetylhydrolase IB subunit alpha2-like [Frankliniella occidentalis]KAE8742372.1 hypothetical protein FOCC_FOCC012059 [Frankliniella occidentalis]